MISVVLVSHQSAAFLEECIQSILTQSYPNFELLILDNASTDTTRDKIEKLVKLDSRIRYFPKSVNIGVGSALEFLFNQSSGDYIAQIGHDDIWMPGHLQLLHDAISKSQVGAVFGTPLIIDMNGTLKEVFRSPFKHSLLTNLSLHAVLEKLLQQNFLCAPASLIRKSLLMGFVPTPANDQLQDWELWLHLIIQAPFQALAAETVKYRVHDSNLSGPRGSHVQTQIDKRQVLFRLIDSLPFQNYIESTPTDVQDNIFRTLTKLALEDLALSELLLVALRSWESRSKITARSLTLTLSLLYLFAGSVRKSFNRGLSVIPDWLNALLKPAYAIIINDPMVALEGPAQRIFHASRLGVYRIGLPRRRLWLSIHRFRNQQDYLRMLENGYSQSIHHFSPIHSFLSAARIRIQNHFKKSVAS